MAYKMPITWQVLYEEVYIELIPEESRLNTGDFMKSIFPEDIFNQIFSVPKSHAGKNPVFAAFYAGSESERVFARMRSYLLEVQRFEKKYTYDTCPAVEAFRGCWEELIPGLTHPSKTPGLIEDLTENISSGILNLIPEDHSDLLETLNVLCDEEQYSLVLAILSIVATTLSSFELSRNDAGADDSCVQAIVKDRSPSKKRTNTSTPAEILPITLEQLHDEVLKRLYPDHELKGMLDFALAVIPKSLQDVVNISVGGKTTKRLKTLAIYHANKLSCARSEEIRKYINNQKTESGERYVFYSAPVILEFQAIWETLLPQSAESAAAVADFVKSIPDEPLKIRLRLEALLGKHPSSLVLAILSTIAVSLSCFCDTSSDSENEKLASIVLPPIPDELVSPMLRYARSAVSDSGVSFAQFQQTVSPLLETLVEKGEAAYHLYQKALQCNLLSDADSYLRQSVTAGYEPALKIWYAEKVKDLLAEAQEIYDDGNILDSQAVKKCGQNCEEILKLSAYATTACLGEVCYILYICITNNYTPSDLVGEKNSDTMAAATRYLEMSHKYGYSKAQEAWEAFQEDTRIVPEPTVSEDSTGGTYHCNTKNGYTDVFAQSAPRCWSEAPLDLNRLTADRMPRRFLLLDDDFAKNLEDLFRILQFIQTGHPNPGTLKWEIFIRHDSDSIHMLIDTAMARISDYALPIYILNDAKLAAQQLLSRHPLFYPVRFLPLKKEANPVGERSLLHFVVLGDSDVTEWLVREAFTVMGFRNDAIRSKITVLAKNGKDFERSLKGRFPGMVQSSIDIEGLELPEITGEDLDLNSRMLNEYIEKFSGETPYCYFAVATDSDEQNLTLATRVRESLIRAALHNQNADLLLDMPPVAFHCRNAQIAHLSRSMVVENERHGLRWYNTRSLIPFGDTPSLYSFGDITGGTFADLAKCMHFQYCQIPSEDVLNRTSDAASAEKDFYLRQYNMDSSTSVALSIPYRLFQFRDSNNLRQLIPEAWDIRNHTRFASVEHLKKLAKQLRNAASRAIEDNNAEYKEIAEWEHLRWIRWMLSRGWMPASFEEALFAYKQGNPRQQLFACKIHPCICSYRRLEELTKFLTANDGPSKDFYKSVLDNIVDTNKLLDLEWTTPQNTRTDIEPER